MYALLGTNKQVLVYGLYSGREVMDLMSINDCVAFVGRYVGQNHMDMTAIWSRQEFRRRYAALNPASTRLRRWVWRNFQATMPMFYGACGVLFLVFASILYTVYNFTFGR